MNVPFVIAQATTPSGTSSGVAPVQTIKLIKPESGHAEVFHLSASGPVKVDFSAIANEKITLVHVGDDLIVLFDNDTTTTLDNFFNAANQPAPNVYVELGDGRDVTSTMFAAEFPFTTDQSVLPAAGDQGQSGHPFPGPEVDPLASWNPLPLQPPEELPNWQINNFLLNDFINDHPTFGDNADVQLDEDSLDSPFPGNHDLPTPSQGDDDGGASFSGTMHYDFHNDGPAATNPLVIDTVSLNALGLKSHGDPVVFNWDSTTFTLTGYVDNDGTPGLSGGDKTVLTLKFGPDVLAPGNDHSFTVNMLAPFDDAPGGNENNEILPLNITITDSNGDPISGTVNINIDDDMPVMGQGDRDWTLDEDVLTNGNDALDNPADTNDYTLIANKNLGVNWGADGPGTLSFIQSDNTGTHPIITITDQNGNPVGGPLQSNGVDLVYNITPNLDRGQTLTATAGGNTIFTITLDPDAGPNGTFTFDLQGHLDHPAGDGQNQLDLNFGFTATDFDVDPVDSNIVIRITDDVPYIIGGDRDWTLDEDVLTNGNDALDSPADTNDYTTISNKNLGVHWGADGPGTLTFAATDATHPIITITDQNGNPISGPLQSNGVDLVYNITPNLDHGQTLTATAGANTIFTVTLDPDAGPNGTFTFDLQGHLDHPTDDGQNRLDLNFGFTATDGDSDPMNSNIVIRITDDVPYVIGQGENVSVNENDIATPWSLGTSPFDGHTDSGGAAFATGNLSGLVASGVDTPITWGFSADAITKMEALGLFSKQTAFPDNGQSLSYTVTQVGGDTVLSAFEPTTPGIPGSGNIVFTFTLDTSSGDFTFRLFDELIHVAGDGTNTDLRSGGPTDGPGGTQASIPYIDFGSIITATDSDGDSVTLTDKVHVTVVDDIPQVHIGVDPLGIVQHDETPGVQNSIFQLPPDLADSDTNSSAVKAVFAALEAGHQTGDDPDVSGSGAIGYAQSALPVVFNQDLLNLTVGADSPPEGSTFSLQVTNGTYSGVQTTEGVNIYLYSENGLIVGRLGGDSDATPDQPNPIGEIAFAIAIESNGKIDLAQYLSLHHLNSGDSDDSISLADGTVSAVLSITDSDGDTVTDSADISGHIRFDDDGPDVGHNAIVQVDDDVLGGNPNGPGDDADAVNTIGTLSHDYGSDGAGSTLLLDTGAPSGFTYAVSDGGKVLLISQNSTGIEVLRVTLTDSTSGAYTVEQLHAIDHPKGQNENNDKFNIAYRVIDGDDDHVDGHLQINVDDDTPIATGNIVSDSADEDGLGGHDVDAGRPGEVAGTNSAIATGSLGALFSPGADVPLTYSLLHTNAAINTLTNQHLHSGGTELSYSVSGDTLTGYIESGGTGGYQSGTDTAVFTLQVTSTGSYTFTLLGELDHPTLNGLAEDNAENTLAIKFGGLIHAVDHDDDPINASGPDAFQITVLDDIPSIVSGGKDFIIDGDFAGGPGDFPLHANEWGTNSGADTDGITGWTVTGSSTNPAGFVELERVGDGYLGMHTSTGGSMIDMAASPGNIAISQTVSGLASGQTYAIQFEAGAPFPTTAELQVYWGGTLIGTIDPSGPGQLTSYNYIVTSDGSPQVLEFREVGDVTSPTPGAADGGYHGTYLANVAMVVASVVDEDGLPTGNHDLPVPSVGDVAVPNTDGDNNEATTTGSLNITWGVDDTDGGTDGAAADTSFIQDGAGTTLTGRNVTFTNDSVVVSGGIPLTSNGEAVTFHLSANNTVLTGIAGGREVFTVSLSDDDSGWYRFILKDQLDHAPNGNENDITLSFHYTATDFDGDLVSSSFTVGVDDDMPIATDATADARTVFEDGLPGANAEPGHTDLSVTITSATLGSLVSIGADEPGHFDLNGAISGNVQGTVGNQLVNVTSRGEAVLFGTDGSDIVGFINVGGGSGFDSGTDREIFRVHDAGSGNFTFTLEGEIDHLPNSPANDDGQSLALNLAPAFTATDFDGDTVTLAGTLAVNVEDDIPVIAGQNNLIVNGSFEEGHDNLGNGQFSIYHTLPGWSVPDTGAPGSNDDIPFEVQVGNIGDEPAEDGNAKVELDSDFTSGGLPAGGDHVNNSGHTNATIEQVISGTEAGQTYELTFWYSPRPSDGDADSSSLNVLWNGSVVKAIDSSVVADGFQQYTVFVTGTGPGDTLAFQGAGQENTLGAYIDNVSLQHITIVDEDGLPTGNHDSAAGDLVVPNSDLDNNEATNNGTLNIKWGADATDGGTDTYTNLDGFSQDTSGRSVTFTNNNVGISGGALTSHGDPISIALSADGTKLVATAVHGNDAPREVFEVSLSDDGEGAFRFILKDALDHTAGGNENNLLLSFNFTAQDFDGDRTDGNFQVLVNDDIPVVDQVQVLSFDDILNAGAPFADNAERGLDTVSPSYGGFTWAQTGVYNPPDGSHYADHSETNLAFFGEANGTEIGSEYPGIAGSPIVIDRPDGQQFAFLGAWFTSPNTNGLDVTVQAFDASNNLLGTTDITVNQDGPTFFDFSTISGFGLVDHLTMQAPDYFGFDDFTYVLNPTSGVSNVPIIIVDEDDLSIASGDKVTGNNDTAPGDDESHYTTGQLGFKIGADQANGGAANIDFASMDHHAVIDSNGHAVTSGGQALTYVWDPLSSTLFATTDASNLLAATAAAVFKMTITDAQQGDYQFSLLDHIDHAAPILGSDPIENSGENNVDINLIYTVTDFDGDTASGAVRISIDDDVPVASKIVATMGENDDTSVALIAGADFSYGADGASASDGITIGTVTVTGDYIPGSLAGLDIHLDGTNIIVKPGTTFDPLNVGEQSIIHIQYSIKDGDGDIATNEVALTVNGATDNLPPEAHDDHIVTNFASGMQFSIPVAGLLWNEHDADSSSISFVTDSLSSNATLDGSGQNVLFSVTGPAGTQSSFTYSVTDGVNTTTETAFVTRYDDALNNHSTSSDDFLISRFNESAIAISTLDGNDVIVGGNQNGGNTLSGGDNNDLIFGGSNTGPNIIHGNDGNDTIYGGSSTTNLLYGDDGDDTLYTGVNGSHVLDGGSGNDTLFVQANSGSVSLTGGSGDDTFSFMAGSAGNQSVVITDYQNSGAEHDTIDLSALLDTNFGVGSQVSDFVRLSNSGNDVKIQVDTDGAANGHVWTDVATLQSFHTVGNEVLTHFEQQAHQLTVT